MSIKSYVGAYNGTAYIDMPDAYTFTFQKVTGGIKRVPLTYPTAKLKWDDGTGGTSGINNANLEVRARYIKPSGSWNTWNTDKSALVPLRTYTESVGWHGTMGSVTDYFTSDNPTERTVTSTLKILAYPALLGMTAYPNGASQSNWTIEPTADFHLCTITFTLDYPPTFDTTALSYDTPYIYAGLTTASVTVSNSTAYYGGTVSSATLTIGSQTASINGDGTISIALNAAGTFTPTVSVTDSRGQVATETLAPITVLTYSAPSVSFNVERTTQTGTPDDEGTYAVIDCAPTFTDAIATAQAPTVTVTDEDGVVTTPTVTWYSTRSSSGALSGSVTWANLSSGDTVYGLISGFGTQESYQITVTPRDSEGVGTPITQTLATAFYTVDFLAGGHGVAFGQPASQTGFFCNMEAHFKDANSVMRALFDFIHPVGSYYETSDTAFNPNTTWGGTWVLETEGQVHVSAGTNYAISGALSNTTDGGSTDAIIPYHNHSVPAVANAITGGSHTHPVLYRNNGVKSGSYDRLGEVGDNKGSRPNAATATTHTHNLPAHDTDYVGTDGNTVNANMQPYIIVNRWHRTA